VQPGVFYLMSLQKLPFQVLYFFNASAILSLR
jgi:hypothetical protein